MLTSYQPDRNRAGFALAKNRQVRKNLLFPETLAVLPERPRTSGKVVSISDSHKYQFVFTHGTLKKHYSQDYLNKLFSEALADFNATMREKMPDWIGSGLTVFSDNKNE